VPQLPWPCGVAGSVSGDQVTIDSADRGGGKVVPWSRSLEGIVLQAVDWFFSINKERNS